MSSLLSGIRFVSQTGDKDSDSGSDKKRRKKSSSRTSKSRSKASASAASHLDGDSPRPARSAPSNVRQNNSKEKRINSTIEEKLRRESSSRKNKDKLKKKNKKKKKKESRKKDSVASPQSSSEEDPAKSPPETQLGVVSTRQRESWMTAPMDEMLFGQRSPSLTDEQRKEQQEKEKRESEVKAGIREPDTGLLYGLSYPKGQHPPQVTTPASSSAVSNAGENLDPPLPTIGDGGASWRLKMLQRAEKRAKEEGKDIRGIVEQHYGKIQDLEERTQNRARSNAHLEYRKNWSSRVDSKRNISEGKRRLEIGRDMSDASVMKKYKTRVESSLSRLGKDSSDAKDNTAERSDAEGDCDADSIEQGIEYDSLFDKSEKRMKEDAEKRDRDRDRSRDRERRGARDVERGERGRERRRERRRRSESPDRKEVYRVSRYESRGEDSARPVREKMSKTRVKPETEEDVRKRRETEEEAKKRAAFLYGGRPKKSVTVEPPKEEASESGVVDLNQLAAKVMRAKLLGQTELVKKLSVQFADAEEKQRDSERVDNVVVLESKVPGARSKAPSQVSISDMVADEKRQRMTSQSSAFAQIQTEMDTLSKQKVFFHNTEDQYDAISDATGSTFSDKKAKRLEQKFIDKQQQRATMDHAKYEKSVQRCTHCLSAAAFPTGNLVSYGKNIYLAYLSQSTPFKSRHALVRDHCRLSTITHTGASILYEEDCWEELEKYKRSLRAMFAKEEKAVVFLEYTYENHLQRHSYIDCVPIPRECEQDVPIYFKQALTNVDEEWSQHKKIYDTHPVNKPLKQVIAKNFAYFHVEWSDGGYAHVVEDSSKMKSTFGLEVLAGLLDIDPFTSAFLFGRSASKRRETEHDVKVHDASLGQFCQKFKSFDWTRTSDETPGDSDHE